MRALVINLEKKLSIGRTVCLTFRNAGTLLSRVIVFCVGWAFFGADAGTQVTPDDEHNFMVCVYFSLL